MSVTDQLKFANSLVGHKVTNKNIISNYAYGRRSAYGIVKKIEVITDEKGFNGLDLDIGIEDMNTMRNLLKRDEILVFVIGQWELGNRMILCVSVSPDANQYPSLYVAPSFKYIEAPDNNPTLDFAKSIFLAGSISNSDDWQKDTSKTLLPHLNVVNPRRANYNCDDSSLERGQITWEYNKLRECGILLFYFHHQTLNPITLFELGAAMERKKQYIYICVHPCYQRKNDVVIQAELKGFTVSFDLDETLKTIINVHSLTKR